MEDWHTPSSRFSKLKLQIRIRLLKNKSRENATDRKFEEEACPLGAIHWKPEKRIPEVNHLNRLKIELKRRVKRHRGHQK